MLAGRLLLPFLMIALAGGCATRPDAAPISSSTSRLLDYTNALRARADLPALTKAEFDQQQLRQAQVETEYEVVRLRNAAFEPAATLQQQGRSVVRATFTEPRLFIRMPGVSFERTGDDRITLSLSSDGRARTGVAVLPAARLDELRMLEEAAFAPDPPRVPAGWQRGDPVPARPDGVCHAWGTTIERITPTGTDKVSAHGCYATPLVKARLDYAVALARLAAESVPGCPDRAAAKTDPFGTLARCFGTFDPATSDNP